MNIFLKIINTIVAIILSAVFSVQSAVMKPTVTSVLNETDAYSVYSLKYSKIEANNAKDKKMRAWREGFVTGNGINGSVNAGAPYDDVLIYQNINFIMPRETIRQSEDISGNLDQVRQTIASGEECYTDHDWYSMYTFHPAGQLRMTQDNHIATSYMRWCNYETGEVSLRYKDINGTWTRSTFTSRTDNATITKIEESSKSSKVNITFSFDDISKMYNFGDNAEAGMEYKKIAASDGSYLAEVAHYPAFDGSELNNAGYATVTYIISVGGTREKILQDDSAETINKGTEQNPAVRITDADAVYLVTISDRDLNMGTFDEFKTQESYELVSNLVSQCTATAEKYGGDNFNYESALAPSASEQSELYNAVSVDFGSGFTDSLSNEALLEFAQSRSRLTGSMVERVYNAGRYAMICCSGGDSISRLYGMWTGEWGARWNGAYTMDANVNLQCSGMNSAHCYSYSVSYVNFVLKQLDDWKTNALHDYGFKDAIQVPCNFDGDSAISVEYNSTYAFQYWNCGADWMIIPIYEFWQCYGDVTIVTADGNKQLLEDVLIPLLELHANFWKQMLTPEYYTDSDGGIHYEKGKTSLGTDEYYCILPGYSPENTPAGRESAVTANTACDIAAAKNGFEMLIDAKNAVNDTTENEEISEYIKNLPPYIYDDTGAIKEWACNIYTENNEHRHISHLYCAWPGNETQNNESLKNACIQAIDNRNSAGKKSEETQTHGWLHKGLVASRLKDSELVTESLKTLFTNNVYYTSLLTDHNTTRGSDCYCTDTSLGVVGVIDEMLMYSDTGKIEILPALAKGLESGSISGLMAKTQAEVSIVWGNGKAEATITSNKNQTIEISCNSSDSQSITFKKGETKTIEFDI